MIKKLNPLVLLIINLIVPIWTMFSTNSWIAIYLFVFSGVLLLVFKEIKRLLYATIFFVAMGLLSYYFLQSPYAYIRALSMVTFIMYNFTPVMMNASLLFYNYSPSELLSSLHPLHLNRKFILALTIALRYIPTFQTEFRLMKQSMAMRGIAFSFKHPVRSFAYFITPQLFRCSLLAEELTAAGITKGIDHPSSRTCVFTDQWSLFDTITLLVFFIGFGGLIWWGASL